MKGDFEKCYLTCSTALHARPYSRDLKKMRQMCKKAIDNSVDPDVLCILDRTDEKEVNNLLQVSTQCEDLCEYIKSRREFQRIWEPDLTRRPLKLNSEQLLELADENCALAEKYLLKGDIESCKKICLETIDILENSFNYYSLENLKIKSNVLHFLGIACLLDNDIISALECHLQQLKLAESCNMSELKKKALQNIGEDFLKYDDFEQALRAFRQSLNFMNSRNEEATTFYKIASCELYLDYLDNANDDAREALSASISCNNGRLQCDAILLLAEVAVKEKNMKEAERLYKEALVIAEENEDSRLDEISSLINMFHGRSNVQIQQQSNLSVVDRLEDISDSLEKSSVNYLETATDDAREALSALISRTDGRLQCDAILLLAETAVREENMKEAERLYKEASVIAKENGDSRLDEMRNLIKMFHEQSDVQIQQQSNLSVVDRLEDISDSLEKSPVNYSENVTDDVSEALSALISSTDGQFLCDAILLLAKTAVKEENMKKAERLYKEALVIAEKHGDSRLDEISSLINMFHERSSVQIQQESILNAIDRLEDVRDSLGKIPVNTEIEKRSEEYDSSDSG
ncbi:tetratricopeptide repeat protein 25 [Caerostris extrusa]|uniref:Outer dynein arm-docking complex subunit 4 n=1 Tax=Caerostris extrusa TaxID=172846 RepID=A0AAV4VIK0_CAEEX|nr:tetratricopeptide repeat protein 25 [Caerostris extrusa]